MGIQLTADPGNARSRRTRTRLLDAARQLLESDGFAALSMGAIAERAGVTRKAVYLHFAGRAELVTALFDYVSAAEDLAGSLRKVWSAPDADTALSEWAQHLARFHVRVRAIDLAAAHAADTDPDAFNHRRQIAADQYATCRRLADRLLSDRRLAPPWTAATAADLLYGVMSFDTMARLLDDRGWTSKRYADDLTILLKRTLLTPAPERQR